MQVALMELRAARVDFPLFEGERAAILRQACLDAAVFIALQQAAPRRFFGRSYRVDGPLPRGPGQSCAKASNGRPKRGSYKTVTVPAKTGRCLQGRAFVPVIGLGGLRA